MSFSMGFDLFLSETNPRAGFPGLPAVQQSRIIRQGFYYLSAMIIFQLTF